jgi:hypothetical protein
MTAPHINIKTTPNIIYTRIAADTTPVFTRGRPGAGCGVADASRVSPGIPEDTSIKTQVPAPHGVTSSMPGIGRKRD